ncbi:MAG: class 1 isoprenoid biosynthesis enzyme [Candidatus Sericytochromatia bacterium]|nr:class 1 isoprenoid biosynthesis enzyme [Candidatus Tanganyikabacteria bacterium]
MQVPETLRQLHEAIWREVYLAADILDDWQDGDLDTEPHRLLAPLATIRGLARAMTWAGQSPQPGFTLTILSRTLENLVHAQAWDLAPNTAEGSTLVASLENRTGATMGGMLEMLAGFSPEGRNWCTHYADWGHKVGAALQWRSDLDAAVEAGPQSARWQFFQQTVIGLGIEGPVPAGLILASVRLRLAQLRATVLEAVAEMQPAEVVAAFDEAFAVALDLRLAERFTERDS